MKAEEKKKKSEREVDVIESRKHNRKGCFLNKILKNDKPLAKKKKKEEEKFSIRKKNQKNQNPAKRIRKEKKKKNQKKTNCNIRNDVISIDLMDIKG